MSQIDRQALAEALEILKHSEEKITNKIPKKFIKFLNENADSEYKVNINFLNNNWDESIKQDTKAILALIYRDYIVSEEEKQKLLLQEKDRRKKEEKELREKYNPDNIFKKDNNISKNQETTQQNNNMQLIEIKKETWYMKIWNKIKSFFGKKHD